MEKAIDDKINKIYALINEYEETIRKNKKKLKDLYECGDLFVNEKKILSRYCEIFDFEEHFNKMEYMKKI